MKKNIFLTILLIAIVFYISNKSFETKTEPKIYDKIILLSYDRPRDEYLAKSELNIKNFKISLSKIKIVDSIDLNENQSKKILEILNLPIEVGSMADCYNPRHILLFYKNSKLIGFYEFCAECGGCRKSDNINIPMLCTENGEKLIKLFKEMNLKNTGEDKGH